MSGFEHFSSHLLREQRRDRLRIISELLFSSYKTPETFIICTRKNAAEKSVVSLDLLSLIDDKACEERAIERFLECGLCKERRRKTASTVACR